MYHINLYILYNVKPCSYHDSYVGVQPSTIKLDLQNDLLLHLCKKVQWICWAPLSRTIGVHWKRANPVISTKLQGDDAYVHVYDASLYTSCISCGHIHVLGAIKNATHTNFYMHAFLWYNVCVTMTFLSILYSFRLLLLFFVGDFALTAKYPNSIGPVGGEYQKCIKDRLIVRAHCNLVALRCGHHTQSVRWNTAVHDSSAAPTSERWSMVRKCRSVCLVETRSCFFPDMVGRRCILFPYTCTLSTRDGRQISVPWTWRDKRLYDNVGSSNVITYIAMFFFTYTWHFLANGVGALRMPFFKKTKQTTTTHTQVSKT